MLYSNYMSKNFTENILEPYLLRCRSGRTAVEYVGYVRLLCDYCKKDFLELTEDDVELAVNSWRNKGLARRTIRTRLACYSSIVKFLKENIEDIDFIDPFEHIVRPDVCDDIKPQKIPSMEELDIIFSEAKKEGDMWYLILALVARACISPSKIIQITKESIFCDGNIRGLYFKNKSMTVLPDDVANLLESYLEGNTLTDEDGHIFFNKHGRALTLKNLDTGIMNIIKRTGIKEHYTLINIRSRGILELAKAGADEKTIANYANIGLMRTRQFIEAKSIVEGCPANLVNFSIKPVFST